MFLLCIRTTLHHLQGRFTTSLFNRLTLYFDNGNAINNRITKNKTNCEWLLTMNIITRHDCKQTPQFDQMLTKQ